MNTPAHDQLPVLVLVVHHACAPATVYWDGALAILSFVPDRWLKAISDHIQIKNRTGHIVITLELASICEVRHYLFFKHSHAI